MSPFTSCADAGSSRTRPAWSTRTSATNSPVRISERPIIDRNAGVSGAVSPSGPSTVADAMLRATSPPTASSAAVAAGTARVAPPARLTIKRTSSSV